MTEHSKEVMERRRQGFEAHYTLRYGMNISAGYYDDIASYSSHTVNERWMAWNAALDSVEIELPAKFNGDHGGCIHEAGVHDDVIDECREAIESTGLGLRVKP